MNQLEEKLQRMISLFECLIPGGRETENMLHRKFAAKRKHGEWFALSKDDIEGLKSVAITSDGY